MNWQHGDFNAIAYSQPSGDHERQLVVYCWDEVTQSSAPGFTVTPDDIASLTPPAENTLLFSAPECGAYFYHLTTGEFQLNIVTVNELYVMIDNDLDFHDATRRRSTRR